MKNLLERVKYNLGSSKLNLSIFISSIIVSILCIAILFIVISRGDEIDNNVIEYETVVKYNHITEIVERPTTTADQETTTKKPEEETTTKSNVFVDGVDVNKATMLEANIVMNADWESGNDRFMGYNIELKNVSKKEIKDWEIVLAFTKDVTLSQGWGGEFEAFGERMVIKPVDYTNKIQPGATVSSIGMNLSASDYAYIYQYTVKVGDYSETVKVDYEEKETPSIEKETPTSGQEQSSKEEEATTEKEEESTEKETESTTKPTQQTQAQTPGNNSQASNGYYSKHGQLRVIGTDLCDSNGKKFQIQGVSTHGLSWFPQYVNKAAFGDLKSMGINAVRLALYTSEYNGYCSGGNQSELKQLIDNGVNYATEQDMYVIIDWHVLNDQNPNRHLSESLAFFDEVSKKYQAQGNVIYEICNEPNSGVNWDDGSDNDIKSYAENVIATIRKNDKDAVIIVGTPTWSQDVDVVANSPLDTKKYQNVMYALHFYAATHKDNIRNKLVVAREKGLPVFVSEFSICEASGNGYNDTASADQWMSLLDFYNISYVAWSLANKAESASLISSGCDKTSGFTINDFSESGKWYMNHVGK